MTVFFWYLAKSYLSSVRYHTRIHWTIHFLQGYQKHTVMFNWSPCISMKKFINISQLVYPTYFQLTYRVTSYTWLCCSGTYSDASLRYCTVAYTEQVTFYKVPETHGHMKMVTLYTMSGP